MPKFESPLGNKNFVGPTMKEYDVPDESELIHQVEQESVNPVFRQRQAAGMAAADEHARRVRAQHAYQQQQMMYESQEEDPSFEIERQIKEAKEARRTGKVRLSEAARKRIEMLIGMTRHTHEATIGGNLYVFQTLRDKEMRDAIQKSSEFDGSVEQTFEVRKQLLARSIVVLAGVDFSQFVGSSSLEAKLDTIDELDHVLLGRLYSEYLIMVKDATDKYAIKNEADAKEVVEDLKK